MTGTENIIDGVLSEALSQEVICELSPEQQEEARHRQAPLTGRGVITCSRNFASSQMDPFVDYMGKTILLAVSRQLHSSETYHSEVKKKKKEGGWVMGKGRPLA